mmetsp:Transcript_2588/g.4778  ORF Transcript_2588/g.4778 Transcript_2588/m.4778 type:complete len:218 (+) Transcript_2588:1388-2041(+)
MAANTSRQLAPTQSRSTRRTLVSLSRPCVDITTRFDRWPGLQTTRCSSPRAQMELSTNTASCQRVDEWAMTSCSRALPSRASLSTLIQRLAATQCMLWVATRCCEKCVVDRPRTWCRQTPRWGRLSSRTRQKASSRQSLSPMHLLPFDATSSRLMATTMNSPAILHRPRASVSPLTTTTCSRVERMAVSSCSMSRRRTASSRRETRRMRCSLRTKSS